MYATFELGAEEKQLKGDDSIIRIDANIQSMSWMNKTSVSATPSLAEYRKMFTNQEGWLATGNSNAMVGCTFTTCLSQQQDEFIKQKEKLFNSKLQHDLLTKQTVIATTSTQANTPSSSTNNNNNTQNILTRTNFNLRGHKTDVRIKKILLLFILN